MAAARVVLTEHVVERAEQRIPGVAPARIADVVHDDVVAALAAGRKAATKPRWLAGRGRRRSKLGRPGTVRVVWTECERRAYVLRRVRDRGGLAWLVVTILTADDERRAA